MRAYNLMVNNMSEASTFLWKIIKLKYYFLTIYSDLLSKVHLQSNLIYKKLDYMLKPVNRQFKFIREDKSFLSL